MKIMKPHTHLLALLFCALPAIAQEAAAPRAKPAPPLATPEPGMSWAITIEGASAKADGRRPVRLTGQKGPLVRRDVLEFDSGKTEVWFNIGRGILLEQEQHQRVVALKVEDDAFDAAQRFRVAGFPGIGWVKPEHFVRQGVDPVSGRQVAIYRQEVAPFKLLGEGAEAMALPTGATVEVTATFDARSGWPLQAKVGELQYRYQITRSATATDPPLPPKFRAEMARILGRDKALQTARQRQQERRQKRLEP